MRLYILISTSIGRARVLGVQMSMNRSMFSLVSVTVKVPARGGSCNVDTLDADFAEGELEAPAVLVYQLHVAVHAHQRPARIGRGRPRGRWHDRPPR